MRLAIMQPYFFPYLGYFQLIHAVDKFVIYDDVNYIKRGRINRNSILAHGQVQLLTLETIGASQNRQIRGVGTGTNRKTLLKTIRQNYSRAPCFAVAYSVIEEALTLPEDNLALFLEGGLRVVCSYLGLQPRWLRSSSVDKDASLRGQDKVLAICTTLGATHYINLPGGEALYDRDSFDRRNVSLSFIRPRFITYPQFGAGFAANLSIIDVMMFNDREQCSRLLQEYDLG